MSEKQSEAQIKDYLNALANLLKGQDPALIQDALFDAEQHFREALSDNEAGDIAQVINDYGSPEHIASFYCELEDKVSFALSGKQQSVKHKPAEDSPVENIFSIFKRPAGYRAIAFAFVSMPISIVYFAWTVMLGITSVFFSVVIIGIPLFLMYLKSMQYLSLFEGRMVEHFLDVRMPRRPANPARSEHRSRLRQIIDLIETRQVWTSTLYFALSMPMGIASFLLSAVPALFSVALILTPVVDPLLHTLNPDIAIDLNWYWFPLTTALGTLGLWLSLHIASYLTTIQAKLAKSMLVRTTE